MKQLLLGLVTIFFSYQLWSHSPLMGSNPDDGAKLKKIPSELVMTFKSPAKLVKLDLFMVDSTEKASFLDKIFGQELSEPIRLPYDDFLMQAKKTQTIQLPFLRPASYRVIWRALGEDGHVMKGNLNFTVIAE